MKTRLIIILMVSFTLSAAFTRNKNKEVLNHANRLLILTADDYGAAKNINDGIYSAVKKDLITEISALTNFRESLVGLKSISDNYPNIGIGVHLNITTGKPLTNPLLVPSLVNDKGNFYPIDDLLPQLKKISLVELKTELRAQIKILYDNEIRIDHLSDQYGILCLYPPFFSLVIELAKEFNLPIRSPLIASMKYPDIFPHSYMKEEGTRILKNFLVTYPGKVLSYIIDFQLREINKRTVKLDSAGIVHPDLMVDYFYGNPTVSNLNYILENLPPGVNELILHLGTNERQSEYPSGLDQDYLNNRELELMVISSCSLNSYLEFLNIKKSKYSELFALKKN